MSPFDDDGLVLVCRRCEQALDSSDRFCRACGASLGSWLPFFKSRVGILLLLFLGIGPLALPMLWRSPAFDDTQKKWITALNLAYILVFAWVLVWVYNFVMFQSSGLQVEPGF